MKKLIFLLGFLISVNCISAQNVDFNKPLDIDPSVKTGTLENGLKYYIRKNHKPENRVYLYLALNVGSINEDDNQQGLAHFTEHMAFNGTKNFKKNELIDVLEKMGVKFGAELNAHTGFTETVYKLQLPTDKPELVDKGFLILEDWAGGLAFNEKEVDKERGVVREEWRLGLGADDRMSKVYLPVLLKGSKFAERLPIGKIDIINTFKYQTLKQFYTDWYRPNLMAVVVVGDIDIDDAENKIKKHFGKMTNPVNERKNPNEDIPNNVEPLISIAYDKEATNSAIQMFIKHPKKEQKTIGDYRRFLLYNIYQQMINGRFNELSRKEDAPFIYAYAGYGDFLAKTKDAYVIGAAAKENQILNTLNVMLNENIRIIQHGFTQTELDRAKEDLKSSYEAMLKEKDKTESSSFVREYVGNFLNDEPIPGIENEYKYMLASLTTISLEEVNKMAENFITKENIAVAVTCPEKEGIKIPKESEIKQIIDNSFKPENKLEAFVDKVDAAPLLSEIPKSGTIIKESKNKEFDYTELVLKNGVKVILKPTDFKNDEILFTAFSPGGTSLYPDSDIMSAMFTSTVVNLGGIGQLDKTQLEKKLAGKIVSVTPYVSEIKEGISGSSTPKDFETLLQLTYLYFKQPRKDTSAFNAFISKLKNQIKFLSSSPQIVFVDTLTKIITSNNPRSIAIPTLEQIDKINLDKAFKMYEDRFADASDFTFIFVGNFNIDSIKPLLQTYIGSLPSTNRKESWKNVEPKFPDNTKDITVKKGLEPKSSVAIVMNDNFEWEYKNIMKLQTMMDIIDIKLREKMREDKSGIYGLQASASQDKYPESKYTIQFAWGCSPKNVKKLSKVLFKEIKSMQKNGPVMTDLEKVKENLKRDRETNIKKNNYWLARLENYYFNGIKLNTLDEYKQMVDNLTLADIKEAANKYLKPDYYVKVVLMPEK